ncbi:hypothetical protein K2173_006634 [Erythroxylum novogranatense]|uniref:RRM domain-containing protein n=1 Tax=Erythroxylum novogranatense TaxID=1862640 RepID=A0AAV8T5R0_9ROSI|nr:hypothetical protein K2173_006634 [Erythroxylum novogranatense]
MITKNSKDGFCALDPTNSSPINGPKELRSNGWGILPGSNAYNASPDASLFSSSLPVLPHKKLDLNGMDHGHRFLDNISSDNHKLPSDGENGDLLEDIETHAIGSLLPGDEDDLLAAVMDDFDPIKLPGSLEDMEDDLFRSVGGMELENDPQEGLSISVSKLNFSDGIVGNGGPHYNLSNGVGTVAGEHPYGEHPSITLFVRNINSNVEDSELRSLFEQYGDIRTLYTACKHRGFVMISYYDIRAARTAMRQLQNKPLRRRKLDIHFSIPKDNPSEKDINQGTLVVFNLDPSVSNEDLRQIFGAYGEVKEIRETPHKRHHKFIEFYDVRAAEAALKSLNRSDIAGKRIKLEPSRPGGARRNLMLQLNQDLEQDDSWSFRHPVGSPMTNSPPGNWAQFNSPIEQSPLQNMNKSPIFRTMSPTTSNHLPGLASLLNPHVSNSLKVAPIGKDQGRGGIAENTFTNTNSVHGSSFQQSHSLPELKLKNMPPFGPSTPNGSSMETLSGPQFLWGSTKPLADHSSTSAFPMSSMGHPFSSNGKGHGFPYINQHTSLIGAAQHHNHVGSAPSGFPFERHFGIFPDSPDTSFMNPVSYGAIGLGHNDGNFLMNMGNRAPMNTGVTIPKNMSENGSSSYRMMSSPRLSPVLLGNIPYAGLTSSSIEGFTERGRSRRVENNVNQVENKKHFQLDLDKIINGEDARTTLMIKNIPNKYTSKMLLAAIDENHRGTYDFLYLPIDFKNKCNVGYAFINMLSPKHIVSFYQAFNGKKWEKFNSEKVASLAYARIQGKAALIMHFQNSSLMNEDKRCRPILFDTEGLDAGDKAVQEHLQSSSLNIQIHQPDGLHSEESLENPPKDDSSKTAEKR